MTRAHRDHDPLKVLAALIGAPLIAVSVGALLTILLPLPEEHRFAWGIHAIVPVWACWFCTLPLARTGRRAWAVCAVFALALGALLIQHEALGQSLWFDG